MIELKPKEARVLGVLVEKAQTTPGQYPMTTNGLVTGCNQKSNRHPIVNYDEETILDALDGLRSKGLAVMVNMAGSRVMKYKHEARQTLEIDTSQLVMLTELMLRGPQTIGELRGRASRMHPIESLEVAENVLESMMEREEPLVSRIAPAPGSRAERYVQLLCPNLHRLDESSGSPLGPASSQGAAESSGTDAALGQRVDKLEREVEELKQAFEQLKATFQ